VVCTKQTWLSRWFQLLLGGGTLAALGCWGWRLASQLSTQLLRRHTKSSSSPDPGSGSSGSWGSAAATLHGLEWLCFVGVGIGVGMAASLLRFVLSRNSLKLRCPGPRHPHPICMWLSVFCHRLELVMWGA
jgi:hypothetical protein